MGKSAKNTRISGQFGTHHSLKNMNKGATGAKGKGSLADSKKKKLAKAMEAVAKARDRGNTMQQSGDD